MIEKILLICCKKDTLYFCDCCTLYSTEWKSFSLFL